MKNTNCAPLFSIHTFLYFLFLLHFIISISAYNYSYIPSDNIVVNCGSSSDTRTSDGRYWASDVGSEFLRPSPQHNTSTTARPSANPLIPEVPYMTARIFHSQLTYTFPVSAGPKFVRLHFYPTSYSGLDPSTAFLSVNVGRYTLLRNFSASLTSDDLNVAYLSKEFVINVENQILNITFTPSPNAYFDTYAFVNGIEVLSMPSNLYYPGEDVLVPLVGQKAGFFTIDNNTALEMVYRLDVGGDQDVISPEYDTGMFRAWYKDEGYIFGAAFGIVNTNLDFTIRYTPTVPAYTAPEIVYRSTRSMGYSSFNTNYNLTWIFPIDSGFNYLVRLHFCQIYLNTSLINQIVFKIFIDNQTADDVADIASWGGEYGIPVYQDYVVMVPQGNGGKHDLWLALHPNTKSKPMYYDAMLNGLEIFKLSDSDGNLTGPNPPRHESVVGSSTPESLPKQSGKSLKNPIFITGSVVGGFVALSLLCFFVCRLQGGNCTSWWVLCSNSAGAREPNTSSLPSDICRHFSFAEIRAATNNFDKGLLIGVGGFGNVYKGYIDGGATLVAIKRGNITSEQGAHEFQTEIKILSNLRHFHLVSLIGYCEEDQEMILVYDYMAHGTLRDHLYETQKPPLPWKERLKICIGAARGLHYLHTSAKHAIIHRDVKTANILLDEKWVAKVSDFGLSRAGPIALSQTHVSTIVKGSFGYLDPEYYRRRKLTEKSDVYSFGVVLFEVMCARPAVNPMVEEEQVNLAEWALHCHEIGTLDQITDPYLRGQIGSECFTKFTEIAMKCLADRGLERPAMGDVLWNLELALQLQDKADDAKSVGGGSHNKMDANATSINFIERSHGRNNSDTTPGAEFSEIMMPIGR